MKIQCDMCEQKEAAVYCTADEASLCHACDRRVHHANKLANKHLRFSLNPSSDEPPRCDICQERRAFLFCKEDRAILCRECDISIHRANEHTQYHDRFLLAGVKLSDSSSCYDKSSDQALCSSNSNGYSEIDSRKSSIVSEDQNARSAKYFTSVNDHCDGASREEGASMAASSISQYLMETLPGWHGYDSGTLPFMTHDSNNSRDLWSEDLGIFLNSSSSSSSSMDHQISKTRSLSKRVFLDEVESLKKLNKDQHTFKPSSIKRPRQDQLW
ncbi:Zinc finger, B-box [Cynara cardunculus var. scolymus]|uniref:Zinc finger, B-box n=1 Tax=Cynara cardunculus var. scolymus TaxID=59895 RepID=A0A103XLV0_CYNCS|nr:Zinc finger, B-box [Cynara cardunculus var. scolymus]